MDAVRAHAARTQRRRTEPGWCRVEERRRATEVVRVRIPTVAEYAETWLSTLTRPGASTLDDYRMRLRLRILPILGDCLVTDLTKERIRAFLGALIAKGNQRMRADADGMPRPLASATVKGTLTILTMLLDRAVEDGLISRNPTMGLAKEIRKVASTEIEVFSSDELARLEVVSEQDYPEWHAFILCLARTGLRLGEATALEWRDVDFGKRVLLIRRSERRGRAGSTKNHKTRRVDMSRQLCQVFTSLQSLQEAEAAVAGTSPQVRVFLMPNGRPIEDYNFRRSVWAPILRRAGLRYRKPHTLRHTYASLLIEAGEPLTYVQHQLGHHSPAFTLSTYGHLIPRGDRRAVDRLDNRDVAPKDNVNVIPMVRK